MLGPQRVAFWRKAGTGGGGGSGPAAAPTALVNNSSTTSSITISFTIGDATAETEVYRDDALITTLATTVATYTDTGRSANASHAYKVRHKKDGLFSSFLGPQTFESVPNAPTSPSATADSDVQITVTWTDAHSLPVNLYRDAVYVTQIAAGTQTYVDTGRTANTLYSYILRHVNNTWESADATTSATTDNTDGPDAPPSGLSVTAAASVTWALAWTNGDATAETEVWKDGALVTTVGTGVTSYDGAASPGVAAAWKLRHIKNSITSAYSAEVNKTYPNVVNGTLDASGNDFDNTFQFVWTVVANDAESGWDVLLTWEDDLRYTTPQVENTGQDTDGTAVDVSAEYDVNTGGSATATVSFTVAIRNAADEVLASRSRSGQAIQVEPVT